MKKIFWGLLLLLIEIKWGRLPIIAPLVGYLLIWCGLEEVPESETFRQTGRVAAAAAVFAGLVGLKNFLGILHGDPTGVLIDLVLGVAGLAFRLIATYQIAEGVREIEEARGQDLKSGRLSSGWQVVAGGCIAVVALIPFSPLNIVGLLVAFGAWIYYAVKFYQAARIYGEAESE